MLSTTLLLLLPLATLTAQDDEPTIRFGDPAHLEYTQEFFPGTTHDASVPEPDDLLGQMVGSRIAHHWEVVQYFRALAEASPRVVVGSFGKTHEGRDLIWAAISSEANIARLDEIRSNQHALWSGGRGVGSDAMQRVLDSTPPTAWMAYSIHGDETSGVDSSLALAYHLAAGTSANVTDLIDKIVVVIDPMQNPDGRQRILSQLEQSAGYMESLDTASMQRGRWPFGRGNHYLFDMNRDWMPGTQPETRARWKAYRTFNAQLFVDSHEMGSLDTFLFYPPREPINHHVPEYMRDSWMLFGNDQARAFDAWGWSYYTREWADYWYPGYSDSWGSLNGAVGILYEQARFAGTALRRASGEIITYREAVHHQAVASLANLQTLADNRTKILADYLAHRRSNVAADTPGNDRAFVYVPGANKTRERLLLRTLLDQGIEVDQARGTFSGRNVVSRSGETFESREFPSGSYVIEVRQPQSPMVKTYFDLDPRLIREVLEKERKELETKGSSTMYDTTAWSLSHAFDLEGYWVDSIGLQSSRVEAVPEKIGRLIASPQPDRPVYAWIVDGTDDASVVFASRAMELGLAVHLSDKDFETAGTTFARGSLMVRRHENGEDVRARVEQAATAAGVDAYETSSGRAPGDGPDLGGGHFTLLARPRVALLSNSPVSTSSYGHTWHTLDVEIGVPFTMLNAQSFGSYDLRRYNVLVLPPGGVGGVLRDNASALKTWVRGGGTLIACGSAVNGVLGKDIGLSNVKRRRSELKELDKFAFAVKRERAAGTAEIDEAEIWGDAKPEEAASEEGENGDEPEDEPEEIGEKKKDADADVDPDLEREDAWARRFSPQGAFLRGEVSENEWLTVGAEDKELPIMFSGSNVYLSAPPVRTAVRFAPPDELRMSGLLWPEARARIADSAWATVERVGNGQVILFASPPDFRGWSEGTQRLLANAVIYGPGAGARQPRDW